MRARSTVKRLVLPYAVQPKGGKDLRDWLVEDPGSHTFSRLQELKKDASTLPSTSSSRSRGTYAAMVKRQAEYQADAGLELLA